MSPLLPLLLSGAALALITVLCVLAVGKSQSGEVVSPCSVGAHSWVRVASRTPSCIQAPVLAHRSYIANVLARPGERWECIDCGEAIDAMGAAERLAR